MGFIKRSGVLQLLVDVDVVNRRAARQPLCQLRGLGEVVGFDLEALNVAVNRWPQPTYNPAKRKQPERLPWRCR